MEEYKINISKYEHEPDLYRMELFKKEADGELALVSVFREGTDYNGIQWNGFLAIMGFKTYMTFNNIYHIFEINHLYAKSFSDILDRFQRI